MHTPQRGFTLVELSIVLVILGLLIGGVLTGQSLIRAAELRSVATQQARYITAVQTFRDKYFALPGDMTNATAYWGIVSGSTTGSDSACQTAPSTGAATCNGNGDGKVMNISTASNEQFRFWQHLANAGLIEGNYSGIASPTSSTYGTATSNSPVGRISASLWTTFGYGAQSGSVYVFDGQYDNLLEVGGYLVGQDPFAPIFKPEEAYNIDTKLDDGKPATGKVVARVVASGFANCTDASAPATLTANYLLNSTALGCALIFRQAY